MSESLQFYNDDQGYLTWLEANPEGFVLNIDTQGSGEHRVHAARCAYLYPPDPRKRHTSYRKAVARRLDILESWSGSVTRCSCCKVR